MKKEDLFELVWSGATVEEGNIAYNIRLVRKALGDSATDPVYIATVSKQGYRFIGPVTVKSEIEAEMISPTSESEIAETRYREEVVVERAPAETVDITEERKAEVYWGEVQDYSPFKKHRRHFIECVRFVRALLFSRIHIGNCLSVRNLWKSSFDVRSFCIFLDPDHIGSGARHGFEANISWLGNGIAVVGVRLRGRRSIALLCIGTLFTQ